MLAGSPNGSPSARTDVWCGLAINWTTPFRRSIREPRKLWPRFLWDMNRSDCLPWMQGYRTNRTDRTYQHSKTPTNQLPKISLTLYSGTGFITSFNLKLPNANRGLTAQDQ